MAAEGPDSLVARVYAALKLQRGRGAMAAEGRRASARWCRGPWSFNEAAARWPRKDAGPRDLQSLRAELQRGRGAMAAEGGDLSHGFDAHHLASTRPRRDGRGRDPSPGADRPERPGFNEAAARWPRKGE